MDPQELASSSQALQEFAEQRLNAAAYPDCSHRFRTWSCGSCQADLLTPTIERHPGDERGDFMGIVWTACTCGVEERKLSVTSCGETEVKPLAIEPRVCPGCGFNRFHIATCERWEDWGFFDEGTVVARCPCGELIPLVDTD